MGKFLFLLLLLAGGSVSANAQAGSYTISYFGRSFGYFRVPDVQHSNGDRCDATAVDTPQVRSFLQQIDAEKRDGLVALGDNFAPNLASRAIEQGGRLEPKDQLIFDYLKTQSWIHYDEAPPELQQSQAKGESVVNYDNVGCFFKLAGFDATVPGKHEFHYGPERLQEVARYLADPRTGKAVQMLAANLAISTTVANPPTQTRPSPKPENYAFTGPNGSEFAFPSVPLPYMRVFAIQKALSVEGYVKSSGGEFHLQKLTQSGLGEGTDKTATKLYAHAWICPGQLGAHFDTSGCKELSAVGAQGTTLRFKLPLTQFGLYPDSSAVQAGVNYFVCASATGVVAQMTAKNTVCHATFQFHFPFFQRGRASQPNPALYAPLHASAVVFGVVDPDLATQIGPLNQSWQNANSQFKTQLEFADPHEALSQLLETCEEDPACAGKRRILLAQMPWQRAQRLAAHLGGQEKFDLVISQAEEAAATGDITRTDQAAGASELRPLVLTPETTVVADKPDQLRVALATATVRTDQSERTVTNRIRSAEVTLPPEQYTGRKQLWELMVQAGLAPAPAEKATVDERSLVENGILSVMRGYCKADVAILQDRDLYRPEHYAVERPAASELQDLLDRLLWKGDFISCRPVAGASLKQIIAVSNQFASGAKNELTTEGEAGRSIEMLGMFPNPLGGLVTDGAPVEDARQYSVAMTDFLANGQTGYTALASAGAKSSIEASDFNEITALVCHSLVSQISGTESESKFCRAPLKAAAYLDPIEMQPYSFPKGLTPQGQLREWARGNWGSEEILAPVKSNPAEFEAQNRRVLSVRLDKADIGYQQNLHSLSEAQQQQRFGGVQSAQPTSPERYDWTADYLIRVTSSGPNVDRFIQADAQYENSGVKQVFTTATGSSETFQLSVPRNSTGLELGFETRLFPAHEKNITGVRLLTSLRYQSQFSQPFVQFQAADGFLNETLPRGNALLAKVGLRYDGARSWLEFGVQTGPQTQVQSLTLGNVTCDPGNVQLCLGASGTLPLLQDVKELPFHVSTVRRDQTGLFLNGRIHVPLLFKRLDYVIDNQGSLYFNRAGDSPADTRYLEVMTHSLVIPVIGDLAIVPKVDIFLFQNKVTGWHIHGYQTSFTAQYRFDWHTGLRWKDILRYPSPPPSQ